MTSFLTCVRWPANHKPLYTIHDCHNSGLPPLWSIWWNWGQSAIHVIHYPDNQGVFHFARDVKDKLENRCTPRNKIAHQQPQTSQPEGCLVAPRLVNSLSCWRSSLNLSAGCWGGCSVALLAKCLIARDRKEAALAFAVCLCRFKNRLTWSDLSSELGSSADPSAEMEPELCHSWLKGISPMLSTLELLFWLYFLGPRHAASFQS